MIKKYLPYILTFVAILPVLITRDFTPDNELKYLSIADEAIADSHFFAFYNHGIAYADKPPLYLWFVMLGKILFGHHVMFFLTMLSVIPAFVTAHIMGKFANGLLTGNATAVAKLMLFTTLYYLAPMIILRMDMLMVMFITLSLHCFYKMFNNHDPQSVKFVKGQWLLPVWVFLAIFSKGAVGFLLPIAVIIIYLLRMGKIRSIGKYLGWKFWTLLALLCGIWFTCAYADGGKEYLNNLLFHQTIDRAVDAFHHKKPFYYYLETFWYTAAPWSLLSVASLIIAYRKRLMNSPFTVFCSTVFLTTIVMLSCVSSKLEIYLLPSFPFLIFLTVYILSRINRHWLTYGSVTIVAILYIAIFAASLFFKQLTGYVHLPEINLWAPLWTLALILLAGAVYSLYFLAKEKIIHAVGTLSVALLLFIFSASFSLPSFNGMIGMRQGCEKAAELAKEKGIDNYAVYDFRSGVNFDVYLGKQLDIVEKEELPILENAILFVKHRDIARDSTLRNALGTRKIYRYGEYSFAAFE